MAYMQQKFEHQGLNRLSREPTQLIIANRLGFSLSLGRIKLPMVGPAELFRRSISIAVITFG